MNNQKSTIPKPPGPVVLVPTVEVEGRPGRCRINISDLPAYKRRGYTEIEGTRVDPNDEVTSTDDHSDVPDAGTEREVAGTIRNSTTTDEGGETGEGGEGESGYDWSTHTLAELKGFAKQFKLTFPANVNKPALVALLTEGGFVPPGA